MQGPASYTAPHDLLADRVILVTGAGDGIGREAARSFARHGATVVLLGRTTAKLENVYDEIESAGGPQPAIYPLNLEGASGKDYEDMAETLEREFGRLDGLLHNAAELGTLTPFEHYEPEIWYRVMQVNVNSVFHVNQVCLPLLRKSPRASLVFTSSSVGRKGKAYWGAYGVSQFAIQGMMEILADEVENSGAVRINCVDPGPVRTRLRANAYPGEDRDSLPEPALVMPVYLYLMGDDSRTVNGQTILAQP